MKIESIHLKAFRNYKSEKIVFGEGTNIIFGDNAQGKTNIIEAVHLLATGRSHRTKNLSDLILYGENRFVIEATINEEERKEQILLSYDRQRGRLLKVNEVNKARWSELLGMLHVLLFSPESMDIVKGGPAERRRFIDILLCQIDKRYLRSLQQHTAVIRNKAAALRNRAGFENYRAMLPIWNQALAKADAYIIFRRIEIISRLSRYSNNELQVISDGKESLALALFTNCSRTVREAGKAEQKQPSEEELFLLIQEKLETVMNREIDAGLCLVGSHRDDIKMMINNKDARAFASQGQQRSIALSFILASMAIYQEENSAYPLLLLDDVMSELDIKRQAYLIKVLGKTQNILTTTDLKLYSGMENQGRSKRIFVQAGIATEVT